MNETMEEIRKTNIAIFLSTYNGEKFLKKQLNSVFAQRNCNILLTVRDDCSTDNTNNILNEYATQYNIVNITDGINIGPASSFWNILTSYNGKAEYFAFCDQDDIWDEDKLYIAIDKLKDKDKPTVYFCAERNIDAFDNNITQNEKNKNINLSFESEIVCGFCPGCAMVFNRSLFEIVKKMKFRFLPMHDMAVILTALAIGEVIYDSSPHFSRRLHSNNVVASGGKNRTNRLCQSIARWFKQGKEKPLNIFLEELDCYLNKFEVVNYNRNVIKYLIHYKYNIINKIKIYKSGLYKTYNKRAMYSFYIRLILNLL